MSEKATFELQDFLPYLLNLAAEETSLEFRSVYKSRYGLLRTEWRVLFHLGCYGDMLAKDICERGNLHKTKISRAVAALEKRRYLTRKELPHDRRHEMLSLTANGQSVFRDLRGNAENYSRSLRDKFGEEDMQALNRILKMMINKS